jgi:hypothetical protein
MKKIRIGIDVDETILHLKPKWREWIKNNFGIDPDFSQEITNLDWLEFWMDEVLYDDVYPYPEAVEVINNLYDSNKAEIIFISHCFPEHLTSKTKFLERYFKYHEFIDTEHKHLHNLDVLIDDRDIFFEKIKSDSNNNTVCILLKSEYKSKGLADYIMDWYEIKEYFKEILL